MTKEPSFFTSFGYTLVMSLLAIAMLVQYTTLVIDRVTAVRVFGLVAWIVMTIYFGGTFLTRLRERRQGPSL